MILGNSAAKIVDKLKKEITALESPKKVMKNKLKCKRIN